mmetsp:Transcript_96088/g.309932  ORF Transcript_96088/g.309932 Transcript_96088/m.309932 type:complete len:218 (-) Transcript_96088:561-1214(-)
MCEVIHRHMSDCKMRRQPVLWRRCHQGEAEQGLEIGVGTVLQSQGFVQAEADAHRREIIGLDIALFVCAHRRGDRAGSVGALVQLIIGDRSRNCWNDHVPVGLRPQGANVVEALVLQQVRDPAVTKRSLAQLQLELRAEQALDVRQRHLLRLAPRACQNRLQALPGLCKVSDWHRILLQGPCWLQLRSATFLDHRLGREVRHHLALQVSQDLPLRQR